MLTCHFRCRWATEMADTNFQGAKARTFAYTSSGYKNSGGHIVCHEIWACEVIGDGMSKTGMDGNETAHRE